MRLRGAIIGLAVALSLARCDNPRVEKQVIGTHTFMVPESQLLHSIGNGMSFRIGPNERIATRNIIRLSTVQGICPKGIVSGANPSPSLCSERNFVTSNLAEVSPEKLQKVMGDMGDAAWTYIVQDARGDRIVASCTAAAQTSTSGYCFAIARYRDLLFMIRFDEVDLSRLPALVGEVQSTLSIWESK